MRWIRSHRRLGARLALFALAVQIVVSFGHVHLDKLASSAPAAAGLSLLTANRDQTPASPDHHGGAGDVCAICAVIALVASSVVPEAAQLSPPAPAPADWPREFAAAPPLSDPHHSFQARAPPAVG